MIKLLATLIVLSALAVPGMWAQETPTAPAGQKSLAAQLNVYAFPQKGQSVSQQTEDQAACYQFGVQQTGVDPFQLQQQAQQQQQQAAQSQQQINEAGKGAGAKGAVGGAAAGALVGAVAHGADEGKYAAYGAAAGMLMGRRRAKDSQEQASEQLQQQSQQATQQNQEEMGNFKKAFATCLQAKNYIVNY
jgi:hypothetical protein